MLKWAMVLTMLIAMMKAMMIAMKMMTMMWVAMTLVIDMLGLGNGLVLVCVEEKHSIVLIYQWIEKYICVNRMWIVVRLVVGLWKYTCINDIFPLYSLIRNTHASIQCIYSAVMRSIDCIDIATRYLVA